MKKHPFKKSGRGGNEEMMLNITSMADIFTIILVFLLKSFATSAVNVTPSPGLTLPVAQGESPNFEALKVEISESAVTIDSKPIAALSKYQFPSGDVQQNGTSQELGQALRAVRERQVAIAQGNSDVKIDSKVIVIADQHTPYQTVKTVLASAAISGFTDFKLAVVNPN